MNKNLYFTITNDPVDAAGDAIMINADTFLGAIPATATTTELYFNKVDGTADLSKFTVTHANGDCEAFIKAFGDLVSSSPRDGFIIVHDHVTKEGISLITSVALTTL